MRHMVFSDHQEYSFWGNVEFVSNEAAKKERDTLYRQLKKEGSHCKRWVMKNQMRPYAGFGIPDGTVGDVYKLTVYS